MSITLPLKRRKKREGWCISEEVGIFLEAPGGTSIQTESKICLGFLSSMTKSVADRGNFRGSVMLSMGMSVSPMVLFPQKKRVEVL